MTISSFVKIGFGWFLYLTTKIRLRDSGIFLAPILYISFFLPKTIYNMSNFDSQGKSYEFEVLPKLDLADFCILQPGPN